MEFLSPSNHFRRHNSYHENHLHPTVVHHGRREYHVPAVNNFTYRTEVYLQQREKENLNQLPRGTVTTWRNLKYQKEKKDGEQAEIDRVLSMIDAIHGTFNRSLSRPYNQVYSSLYGDDDMSTRLMRTFCQRHDHCLIPDPSTNEDNDTEEVTSTFEYDDEETDFEEDEEEEKENEKKKSYDSGYGGVMAMRRFSREPCLQMIHPLKV